MSALGRPVNRGGRFSRNDVTPSWASAERPVYEGTPLHAPAALAGYLVTGVVYALVAYRLLTAYSRRHPNEHPINGAHRGIH